MKSAGQFFQEQMNDKERADAGLPIPYQFVEVDGVQVFSANYVFEQMMAQSCRIDKVSIKSSVAILIALASIALNIFLLRG